MFSVRARIRRVVGILGVTFWVTLVVCLIVLSGVAVVSGVLVSPSSSLAVVREALLSDSDWGIVEPHSFSLSPESVRSFVWRIKEICIMMEHR